MSAPVIGEVIFRRHYNATGDDRLEVVRADPISRICADMLQEISILTERDEQRWSSLVGDVLTIHADNRTVVYVVDFTSYDPDSDSYLMRWPD